MAIGIGLHCWYCDNGPCTGDCKEDFKQQDMNKKKWISLLNFEGDVFKVVKHRSVFDSFDIVDFKGHAVRQGIRASKVLAIYDGLENIRTSEGRLYDISEEHSNAKPTREALLKFLGLKEAKSKSKNLSISFELSDAQQKDFDEWKSAIKNIYGEYGTFEWTIKPTGIGNGLVVYSKLANAKLDLTDIDSW